MLDKQRILQDLINSIASSLVAATVVCVFLLLIFSQILFYDKVNVADYYIGLKTKTLFNLGDHRLTDRIINKCSIAYNETYERTLCLNNFFKYSFVYNNQTVNTTMSPDDVLINGSDCKGSAGWYDYTLSKLNATHWFVSEPNHIYIKAKFFINAEKECEKINATCEDFETTCILDQGVMKCDENIPIIKGVTNGTK